VQPVDEKPLSPLGLAAATAAGVTSVALVVFLPAGRLDWPRGWLYIALVSVNFVLNLLYLKRVNPGLIAARARFGAGTKRWDVIWSICFAPAFCSIYVVAGLDAVRYGWTSMSGDLWWLGLGVFLPGTLLFTWSMGVNPFFEKTVRIQTERGHRVIDAGPYRFVRHPGYVGFFGWCFSAPLLLGSWWAFAPATIAALGMVVRTALEDRMLLRELPGYADYARRVRYRLVPGIW
jgi:protein-S-isoprenylcysteine O-methyltransferase Ste14